MLKPYAFRVASAPLFPPSDNGIDKHIFLVRCSDLPEDLPKEANAHEGTASLKAAKGASASGPNY